MKINKKLLHELHREPEEKKMSFQDRAGRLFIGFLIIMLLLTILSRAAASVTIAKVDVTFPKKGALNFEVNGLGTLVATAEKYLTLYEGVRVASIFVKEGQAVKEGDLLFQYDTNDLEDILISLEDELVRTKLNLQKLKLNYNKENEGAELKSEWAKLDLKTAKEDLETAKKNIDKQKKQAYKDAKEAYIDALEAYNDKEDEKEKAIQEANKKITEAQEALNEFHEDKDKEDVEILLIIFKTAAKSNNFEAIYETEENIFKKYYGEKEYEKHNKEVEQARKSLTRAKEDYKYRIAEQMEEGPLSHAEQISYRRAIEDAEDAVADLTKEDNELTTAIWDYYNGIISKTDMDKTYEVLFSMLYTEDKNKEKLINSGNKVLASAKEARTDIINEWQKLMDKEEKDLAYEEESMDKARELYYKTLDNTYDYSQEVSAEKTRIIAAERNVEDTDISKNNNANKQIQDIDLQLTEMDIQSKEEAIKEIKDILNNEGNVLSPVAGILVEFKIAIGNLITGSERLCFALDNYGFEAKVTKEEMKHLALGDDMKIQIGNSTEELSMTLEGIGAEDVEGNFTITGIMPQGGYSVGTPISFKVSKQSNPYSNTIPIQALRMDSNNKTYVLIVEETNTVLGNELTALRMDVTVLEKDYIIAAIDNSLSDNIIVSSNKNIKAGDRVRLNDTDYEN